MKKNKSYFNYTKLSRLKKSVDAFRIFNLNLLLGK